MNSRALRMASAGLLFAGTCLTGVLTWSTWVGMNTLVMKRPVRGTASVSSASPVIPEPGSVVSLDEVLVNLPSSKQNRVHTLGIRLELELFDGSGKALIEKRQSGVRHTIIEATYEQNLEKLSTLGGKLYFKETLVNRLNSFLQDAVIRDIHFSQFLIQ